MLDSDEILFKNESPELPRTHPAYVSESIEPWKILIVDDESGVHSVTTFMIKGTEYLGRKFQFLHAYSASEARQLLTQQFPVKNFSR